LLEYLDEFIAFIHKARESGGQVLVHCNQGVSRSASIVIAYLMYKDKVSYSQAYMIAAGARPSIKPNYGFEQQLQKYEQRLLEELNKVLP
jgi:protein-tyrosine phosphatase